MSDKQEAPKHPLDRWRQTQRITVAELAGRIGCTPVSYHRYVRGTRVPHRSIMEKIVKVTNGDVTANDWFEMEAASGTSDEDKPNVV